MNSQSIVMWRCMMAGMLKNYNVDMKQFDYDLNIPISHSAQSSD